MPKCQNLCIAFELDHDSCLDVGSYFLCYSALIKIGRKVVLPVFRTYERCVFVFRKCCGDMIISQTQFYQNVNEPKGCHLIY